MEEEIAEIRRRKVKAILAKQDAQFRWAFDERLARERPELTYYWPKHKSTWWSLLVLAEMEAPVHVQGIDRSIDLVTDHFYDPSHGIFSTGSGHFPIPCLNGNMLYLHFYFDRPHTNRLDAVIEFFDTYQRFDDGDFRTPKTFPYFSNHACYGRHTCYWGIIKLLKGLSFIPSAERTQSADHLLGNCIDFVLHHEVCFRSHARDEFIHPGLGALTFPSLWDDFLEILWLLAREGVCDGKTRHAVDLLRSKMKGEGYWELEHPVSNLIVSVGQKGCANAFITARANQVLQFYA